MKIDSFEQLKVWQHAHELVLSVYRATAQMPGDQRFGLCSQMQRAAVSVPANIAEGFKRHGKPEKIRFYNIAQGSLEELRYYFILCRDLQYLSDFPSKAEKIDYVARMLSALIKSVRDSGRTRPQEQLST
jgi:four helix bundle protein